MVSFLEVELFPHEDPQIYTVKHFLNNELKETKVGENRCRKDIELWKKEACLWDKARDVFDLWHEYLTNLKIITTIKVKYRSSYFETHCVGNKIYGGSEIKYQKVPKENTKSTVEENIIILFSI